METDPGLCGRCRFARVQVSARGGEFLRCGRADRDSRFRRYPPLPVRACSGFVEGLERDHPGGLPQPSGGAPEGPDS